MKHLLVVFSEAVEGQDDDYNDWYTNTHLPEVVSTPGFVAAQRFRYVESAAGGEPPHAYLAIYEVEGDREKARDALMAGRETRVPLPPSMGEVKSWWFTSISDHLES